MTQQKISIYATSDLHAHWRIPGQQSGHSSGGIAHVAAFLTDIDRSRSVVIDNGDLVTGSRLGAWLARREWTSGHPVIAELDRLGFDIGVPGNHDFDRGARRLRSQIDATSRIKYLCANWRSPDGSAALPASTVLNRSGVRIGVIGVVTGHVQRLSNYDALAGTYFIDPVVAVRSEAERLRPIVDILLVSYHGGIERNLATGTLTQYDTGEDQAARIIAEVPGIDGLIAGHQHRTAAAVVSAPAGTAAVVQPGYGGQHLGVLEFYLADSAVTHRTARTVPLDTLCVEDQQQESPLAQLDQQAQLWFDDACSLSDEQIHQVVAARLGLSSTILALPPTTRTWRELDLAFQAPYGVQRFRMPRHELESALRSAPPWSDRGLSAQLAATGADGPIEFLANAALKSVLPHWRVQQATVIDWVEEFAVRESADFTPNSHAD
ncbi:2',3'-cyclic-nucleotide 2'-phosphodiesterase [Leifsonia rubra CMS 76R]|nr:2',3'-cyclic-nucleotide 2'-phosphodiesterase [Leifsonia rubra CMS 76R]